jgi:hypothetical protein
MKIINMNSEVEKYGTVAIYPDNTRNILYELHDNEKLFVYYMTEASKPFTRIYIEQNCVHNFKLLELFRMFYLNKSKFNNEFNADVEKYFAYLLVNSGMRNELEDIKVTPIDLDLNYLTEENIYNSILLITNSLEYHKSVEYLFNFDGIKGTVDNSIVESGNNYYDEGFTDNMFSLLPENKKHINSYYSVKNGNQIVNLYSVNDKYSKELIKSCFNLQKALDIAKENHELFDEHTVNSIIDLIKFFETGDEEYFRSHSKHWLKIKSKIQYTMGFIEVYKDPKAIIGEASAEVTVRKDLEKLNPVLLELEKNLPIDSNHKRDITSSSIMNVSLNKVLFSAGAYGPLRFIAAYCLPNYGDIREDIGSKQVIYEEEKSKVLNKDIVEKFSTTLKKELINKYDMENNINKDIWNLQVVLHETIGHASGKLFERIITDYDLSILGNSVKIGDIIKVDDIIFNKLIKVDKSSLEELRAEINALYISVFEMKILQVNDMYNGWYEKLGEDKLKKQCIINMVETALRRYGTQVEGFVSIIGAHARANILIMNYLIEKEAVKLNEELVMHNEKEYKLYEIIVTNLEKACDVIKELVGIIQSIKSTADGEKCKIMFDKYTSYPVTIEKGNIIRNNIIDVKLILSDGIQQCARKFPKYVLENGTVKIEEYKNIFDQMSYLFE